MFVRRRQGLVIIGLIVAVVASSLPAQAVSAAPVRASVDRSSPTRTKPDPLQRTGASARAAKTARPATATALAPEVASARSTLLAPEAQPATSVALGAATQLAAQACPPNSDDISVPQTAPTQCIAEHLTSTRRNLGYVWNPAGGYTTVPCVKDPRALVSGAVYKIQDCRPGGLQAENTAQARVIAQLNAAGVYGDSSLTGITPNLQWETQVPGSRLRPDLVLYNRADPAGSVGLVEMKGDWSDDDPVAEVATYVATWPGGARPVRAYHFSTPISDNFEVQLDPACKNDPAVHSAYLYHTYSDPSHDGVIRIAQTFRPCPERKKQSDADEDANSYKGKLGADEDHNGVDDFWDFIRNHPELWFLPVAIPAVAYHPLAVPVVVSLNYDALLALEEAMAYADAAAIDAEWAAFIEASPELVAEARAAIMAGDLAAAGLTAEEMALAELALDAGFVTVSYVLIIAVIIVVVIAVIWAIMHWHLFGDPHLATLDGLSYDMQTVGEFHVLRIPSLNLDVQARLAPMGSSTSISVPNAVAFSYNGAYVELLPGGVAYVNDHKIPATQNQVDLGNGAMLLRSGSRFVASFGNGNAALAFDGSRIGFKIAPGVATTGLLGNNDGIPGNDLKYADGSPVTSPTPSVLDGAYADSWRLTDDDSLFRYEDDTSTATYTDLSFPSSVVTLGDFAQSDLNVAQQICTGQGVVAGPQLEACMLDVAETGDAGYATAAAAVTTFLQDAAARTVDSGGNVTESFDGAVGPNFRPNSTEVLGGTTVAGPIFDGSGYSFSVPSLPGHTSASVAFDVYAVGLTSANVENQKLTVTQSDPELSSVITFTPTSASVSSGPATVTSLGAGQTPQGAPYVRYRVSLAGTQYSDQLRVQLAPSGFRGIIGSSLAVDSIAVHIATVAPETFAGSLPLSVSSGTVNGDSRAGAGNLETVGSVDTYTFTVPSGGQRLAAYATACPAESGDAHLTWRVANAAGSVIASGECDGKSLGVVPAGSYTLTVAGPGVTGTYSVAVEAPQEFAAAIPLSAGNGTINGADVAGAGKFEDGASQDAYALTVPSGGQQLSISLRGCPAAGYWTSATWQLINTATQAVAFHGGCSYANLGLVPAGSYLLLVAGGGTAGAYTLDLAGPQSFAAAVPLAVSAGAVNGTAVAGAGKFETSASQDIYTFAVPSGGQVLNLNISGCPATSYLTYLDWRLLNASTGAVVDRGGCSYSSLGSLPAGDYQLVLEAGGLAGGYVLNLEGPQTFAVTLPLTAGDGTLNGGAVAGAGKFETSASQDIYTFTVPAGGQALSLNVATCPTVNYSTPLTWRLLNSSGTKAASGYCGFANLGNLAAGAYQLVLNTGGLAGAYTLNLEAAQTFAVTLPLTAGDGTLNDGSVAGAGKFETSASQDIYAFTVPTGGNVLSLNLSSCPTANYSTPSTWRLLDGSGTKVASGYCGFVNLGNLAAGTYQLVVNAGGLAGAYALALVPSQSFAVTTPLAVTADTVNGATVTGAGRLESTASQDVYTFTVPAGGQTLNLNVANCPTANYSTPLNWKLLDGSGTKVDSGYCSSYNVGSLAGGSYQLIVNAGGLAGTYTLNLEAPQRFAVTTPLVATADTVNGETVTGAGKFETIVSQDIYTFTVPAGGQKLNLNLSACPTANYSTPLSWKLYDSSGATTASGNCGFKVLGTLAAGGYELVVSSGGLAGTYAVNLEKPQTFPVIAPLAVSADSVNGVAVTGAGRFETVASQDIYTFTVPSGGQVLSLGVASCPTANYSTPLSWKLFDSSGASVASGYCSMYSLGAVPAGDYQLVVSSGGMAGTYAVSMVPSEFFAVTMPLAVTANTINGTTATGAGTFETTSSQDIYTFTVPAGGQALILNVATCPTVNYSTSLGWKLINSAGTTVTSGSCSYYNLGTLAAGDYKLVVSAGGLTGTYAVNLEMPQTFPVTTPLAAANGTVGGSAVAGAGNFETVASQDIYTFTVPSGGQVLNLNVAACPTANYSTPLAWKVLDSAGVTVKSGACSYYSLGTLAAGDYKLVVSAAGMAGPYTLNLEPAQKFAVTTPLAVSANTVNGTTVSGAGKFETTVSQDIYTFTVPSGGQELNLNVGTCPTANYSTPLGWKLINSAGTTVKSGGCSYYNLGTLAAGDYQLVVSAAGMAGTYVLNVELPQTFAVTIPLSANNGTLNGAAVAGAGAFETVASQDIYTFTVAAGGQALALAMSSCPTANYSTPLTWKVLDSTGAAVKNGSCSSYSLGTLAAGDYRLMVNAGGMAGPYTVSVQ